MPKIIPIKDLRDTNATYELVMESSDPVYVTKNGYGSFVMMNMECYEKSTALNEVYRQIIQAEDDVKTGLISDPFETLRELRNRYEL
jgi:PHD/YefM family antitoxin component YafN of YafNO toxin-antitoxin module